jgi:hypothetical protein
VTHFPDRQKAGPTELAVAQPTPVPVPPSVGGGGGGPASQVFGQTRAYWHHVPSASVHVAPLVGCASGQPLPAVPPSEAQSPPVFVHVPIRHVVACGRMSPPGQSVESEQDVPSSAVMQAEPGTGRAQHWLSQLGGPPFVPGAGTTLASKPPSTEPLSREEPESEGSAFAGCTSVDDEHAALSARRATGRSERPFMSARRASLMPGGYGCRSETLGRVTFLTATSLLARRGAAPVRFDFGAPSVLTVVRRSCLSRLTRDARATATPAEDRPLDAKGVEGDEG